MSEDEDYVNKPWHRMTDQELLKSRDYWARKVEEAAGWSSAYMAAKCLETAVAVLKHRGITVDNPYPVRYGEKEDAGKS